MITELNFYQQIFPLLVLMPIAASGFLALVLSKGEVCPGQRKRITENMISIWSVLAVGLMMGIESYANTATLVVGFAAVIVGILLNLLQSRLEGKRAIPSSWLRLPIGLAGVTGLLLVWQQQQLLLLLEALLLGAVFAHVVLLRARHRLQAFNTILPITGIVAGILLMLGLLIQAWLSVDPELLTSVQDFVIYRALLLLAALGLWTSPLYSKQDYTPQIVSITTVLLLFAEVMNMGIVSAL